MSFTQATEAALLEALGAPIRQVSATSGGDINQAARIELADGRRFFVKSNPSPPPGMFEAEARGLAFLAEPGIARVPEVVAVADDYLVLPWLERGRATAESMETAGRQLAELHRHGAPCFGLDHDNFIGRLPQDNTPEDDWAAFYRAHRLQPQVEMAASQLPASVLRGLGQVMDDLDALVGPAEPPARLHGDLWGGNLLVDEQGDPWLIDPAACGGHREMDLAMMQLFGGFSARCFAAYEEAWPLSAGADERVPLYQLYYLLVHVNLFGAGYVGGVSSAVAALTR